MQSRKVDNVYSSVPSNDNVFGLAFSLSIIWNIMKRSFFPLATLNKVSFNSCNVKSFLIDSINYWAIINPTSLWHNIFTNTLRIAIYFYLYHYGLMNMITEKKNDVWISMSYPCMIYGSDWRVHQSIPLWWDTVRTTSYLTASNNSIKQAHCMFLACMTCFIKHIAFFTTIFFFLKNYQGIERCEWKK